MQNDSADARRTGAVCARDDYGVEKRRHELFRGRRAGSDKGQFFDVHFRRDNKISMTLGDLKIEGITCQRVETINIFEEVHNHGTCDLTVVPDAKISDKEILSWNKKKITVRGDKKIIFCGIITQCSLINRSDEKILRLTAQSLSATMDIEKKIFTMQSPKKKISDVLKAVKKNFSSAEINVAKDKNISELIYCDNLTGWEFLKAVAEKEGQLLFTNSKTDKIKVSFGFKAFEKFSADKLQILRQRISMDTYKKLEANTYNGARACYFVDTDFFTDNINIGVGCGVNFENQLQAVIASRIFVNDNILCNKITVRHEEGCRARAHDVAKSFDRFFYLTGKVLESKENFVKVHFDCDDKQDKNDAQEIPFESAASNYFYTMPDEKDEVFVYVDNLRSAAMGSLRGKGVSDAADKKSLKTKDVEMHFDSEKISFAAKKNEISEGDGVKFSAKDIIFSSKGDILIQSSAGMLPDNQLIMAAPHMAGYAAYLATMGQPATVQFNPAGATVGKLPATIKNGGAKKESVELSEIAKELDKITGRKNKNSSAKNSGGGSGGKINFNGKKSFLAQVKDSSIGIEGKNLNVKTRALIQVGYIPMAGGGTGSLSKFEGGNPKNRSEKINVEHGSQDRSRVKEKIPPVPDNKTLSR